jgi:hypothetical protein
MSILNQVLSGQVAHLIFTLFLGFFLGLKEKKNPARDIKNYRDYLLWPPLWGSSLPIFKC